uniref:Myotubularin related protein 4 n=1 Tax=Sinocyclocheilus anshuiensis TaxID=1608454 RepID=A0A671L315_9TELE
MGEEGPPSLEYIQARDLFPQKELVKEDDALQVPFPVLQGEWVEFLGRADDDIIAISNYRLHIKFKDSIINVPLRLIEGVESRDMFQLHIISPPHPHPHSLTHTDTHTHTLTHTLTYSHTDTLTLTHSHTHTHTLTHTHSLTLTLTHTHTHSYTH